MTQIRRYPASTQIPVRIGMAMAAITATAGTGWLAAGCRPARSAHELDMADRGTVRIVSRQIERTDRTLHWKWSLIGERNWRKAAANGLDLSLSDTYPLNDPEHRGGCNIWECDLTAEKTATGIAWTATLHGSDGMTVHSNGTTSASAGLALDENVPIRLNGDAEPRLAADVPLAGLGDRTLTLHIAK